VLVELARVRTSDGVVHEAHFYAPDAAGRLAGCDLAAVIVHGSGGNCAAPWVRAYAERFAALGLPVLAANNRGHDIVASAPGLGYIGNAFERMDDCRLDLAATIAAALDRDATRVVLIGHSLGAVKALYYQGETADDRVAGIVATSPPRLSYSFFIASEDGPVFRGYIDRANALVAVGQGSTLLDATFPLVTLYSAATYLDKHGPHENANVIRHAPRITCPLLLMSGTAEVHTRLRGFPAELHAAATGARSREFHMIDGAGHDYADKLPIAIGHAEQWLEKSVLSGGTR
jgi:alpha-beta hydrolase superfamily lysophospholipase